MNNFIICSGNAQINIHVSDRTVPEQIKLTIKAV